MGPEKGMRAAVRRALWGLSAIAFVSLWTLGTVAFSSGPGMNGVDPVNQGCNCHASQAVPATVVTLEGVPADNKYEASKRYDLTISSTTDVTPVTDPANHGGFYLLVSDGPLATRGSTQAAWVQAVTGKKAVEHTKAGEENNAPAADGKQKWEVAWTAPASGDVSIKLWVNRVNGNSEPDAGDHWNKATYNLMGPSTGGKKGSPGFDVALLVSAVALGALVAAIRRRP